MLVVLILPILSIVYIYQYEEEGGKYNWPLIVRKSNNSYEVEMYYQLMSSLDVPEQFTILDILILKSGFESELLTFNDLVNIPDNRWRNDFDRRVELVYPQAYNTTEVITGLLKGQPIPEVSFNSSLFACNTYD